MNETEVKRDLGEITKGAPSGYFVVVPQSREEDTIDVAALISIVAGAWKIILGTAFVAAIVAAVISLQMRNTYRAQAVIAPVTQNSSGSIGELRNQFGGLAALAGVDLGSAGGRTEEMFATLTSTGFARDFISAENLMPVLFADQWDAKTNRWRGGEKPPTVESAVNKFTKEVRSISENAKTGLITVSVEWYSPELAARWTNSMIEMANERMRAEAIQNAKQSIEYLNKELAKTGIVDMHQVIYRLVEEQVNNAMLANVRREYAFRFIDRAVPPESRFSPKRTVMVILGGSIGLFAGLLGVFLHRFLRGSRIGSAAAH